MKKNTKTLLVVFILAASLLVTACGQTQPAGADTSVAPGASAGSGGQTAANGENAIYGEVTAVNGNEITIAVGTLNQQAWPSGQRPQGSGDRQSQPNPTGQPDANASARPSGSRPSMLELTGETKTIPVADESVITRPSFNRPNGQNGNGQQNNGQEEQQPQASAEKAGLADIQVGTTLRIEYASDKTTIQSITILTGFGRGNASASRNGAGPGEPAASAPAF